MNPHNIFVDTNILIGAYANKEQDALALKYLYSLRGKRIYTSALSIAQLASVFQKRKTNKEIKSIIRQIQQKIDIIGFTNADITKSLDIENSDIEDNMQFVICNKVKCFYFVTNNKKDYNSFNTIAPLTAKEIRTIQK